MLKDHYTVKDAVLSPVCSLGQFEVRKMAVMTTDRIQHTGNCVVLTDSSLF